jgi:hypothetical protein
MATIQFKGIDSVVSAFENRNVDAWSICDGKRLIIKGIGRNDLDEFLKLISQSSTNAIYTLKVYEDISDAKKIKSNTPDDGSFNFRLNTDEQEITNSQYAGLNRKLELEQRLGNIERLLTEETNEPEEEEETIGSIIKGLLDEPQKLNQLIEIGKSLMGFPGAKPAIGQIKYAGQIAGLAPGNTINDLPGATEESNYVAGDKLQRLGNAIDTLEKYDGKLVEHLEKLANIATSNPKKFQGLLTMLDIA